MDVADLTRELVSIPSHEDETAAGDFVESWLREQTAAAVERDEDGNVFARVGEGETTLALAGHHDVVPPDDSQVDADGSYVVERRDGRLYGRGTADMKGCVAAAMCALRDVDPAALGCELVFVSFVAEEAGCLGSEAAVDDGFAPDYAVVGEGSTGYSAAGVTDVAVAHKGRRGSTITAHGTAAHASEPESGENAIYRASDAVDVVRDLEFPSTDVMGHEVAGSVAVTEIDGGSAWNVVPERCEVTVDERTVPGERAPIERVEELPGVEWTVDQDLPPMACEDAAFADLVLGVAADSQDGTPEHVVKPHATDAGNLARAGTDCVVVGAAEPGEAHTADESVSLDVLERCYRIYRSVAERL
ncbi:acetylornithine deacetylase [Halomicrobium zhouii]|uniref:Acetylornithine deacetylase n=1 Tax=Halomicrobium zhouii TaxID=767519 RepID=A0A1I6L6T7_9EURY|nr:M20/M25/M40 family metallo-hydrolase [Halomicrobium zhouii]SFR98970.1 acetylornithine deacetylase [Halomicrobium zhouii]